MRFIEFMPLDADHAWTEDQVLTGAEIRAAIDAVYPLEPEPREPHATARAYRFKDGRGRIGFINPVSEPFCGDCNRVRLTADGRLRTCLFSLNETDLRGPMRDGADDRELERIIRDEEFHMNYTRQELARVAPERQGWLLWKARLGRVWKAYLRFAVGLAGLICAVLLTLQYFILLPPFAWLAKRSERQEAEGWSAVPQRGNRGLGNQY